MAVQQGSYGFACARNAPVPGKQNGQQLSEMPKVNIVNAAHGILNTDLAYHKVRSGSRHAVHRNQRAVLFSTWQTALTTCFYHTRSIILLSTGDAIALKMQVHALIQDITVKPPVGKPWSVSALYSPPSRPHTARLSPLVKAYLVVFQPVLRLLDM